MRKQRYTKPKHTTREGWLLAALGPLKRLLDDAGAPAFPDPLVSVGLPSKRAFSKKQVIGECWSEKNTATGVSTIFISPVLDDPQKVLATYLHELIHASVGVACGHKGAFASVCDTVGLAKPYTATTVAEGSELESRLKTIAAELGEFPHIPLEHYKSPTAKAPTRMRKYKCNRCGAIVRAAGRVGGMMCVETYRDGEGGFHDEPVACGGSFEPDDSDDRATTCKARAKPAPELDEF